MRKMKKLAGLLLAMVMLLTLGTSVYADDGYTITISNSVNGYQYTAYQIFKGDLSDDGTTLSNIEWGDDIDSEKLSALYTALSEISVTQDNPEYIDATTTPDEDETISVNPFTDANGDALTSAAAVAAVLATYEDNSEVAQKFAEVIKEYITGNGASSGTTSPYTISVKEAGYYLIVNTVIPSNPSDSTTGYAYSDYILEVVSNVTVSPKADTTTLDKEVDSTTDSENETTADYSVGDDVPFTLIATLPSNFTSYYDKYAVTFHDTLSSGLSFNDDVVVEVYIAYTGLESFDTGVTYYTYSNGVFTEVTIEAPDSSVVYYVGPVVVNESCYTVDKTELTDGCSFEVKIEDVYSLTTTVDSVTTSIDITDSSIIVVEYTAELQSSAASTTTNTASLEYSNNPNSTTTGKTTEDKTTVFTFTLNISKVDGDGDPLEGAGFTLYKEVSVTEDEFNPDMTTYYVVSNGKMTQVESNANYDSTETYYVMVGTISATSQDTYIKVSIDAFDTSVTYYTYDSTSGEYEEVTNTNGTPDSSTTYYTKETKNNLFTVSGLGVGNYVLVESTTPDGYNTLDDYYFTIEAVTEEDANGSASVTSLTIKDAEGNTISGTDGDFTTSTSALTISTSIVNNAGSALPSTGGIGTTIFYILGTLMVFGAAVVLITRRRMSSAE